MPTFQTYIEIPVEVTYSVTPGTKETRHEPADPGEIVIESATVVLRGERHELGPGDVEPDRWRELDDECWTDDERSTDR